MFTQCPKCQSVFMVSDNDISAHEGLVRCGNCYSVFNSSWNLTEDPRTGVTESPRSHDSNSQPASLGSGFTFNFISNDTSRSPSSTAVPDQTTDETPGPENKADKGTADSIDHPDNDDLEPFPEPEKEDEHTEVPVPEGSKKKDGLLYFGSEDETDEEKSIVSNTIEDTKVLQTPPSTGDSPPPDVNQPMQEAGVSESDSASLSMTEESMWPGSELSFENSGKDFELPVLDIDDGESGSSLSDDIGNIPGLPEFFNVEAAAKDDLVEGLGDPLLFNTLIGDAEDISQQQDKEVTAVETAPPGPFLASTGDRDEAAESAQADVSGNSLITDDSIDSEEIFGLEPMSFESLPESADEAFSLDIDSENETAADSVFITSAEEELDDAYEPLSLKPDDSSEILHGLDEFPEPGELSKLNYEDTMEINAMLKAANVSKDQIDSALLSADTSNDDDSDSVEEIMLSSEHGVDPADSAFFSDTENSDSQSGVDAESKKKDKSAGSFLKNLLPLSWGGKKGWVEPAVLDTVETQLIQKLNRGKNKAALPVWVARYSSLAIVALLILTLIGQIGYFYMDKLVRIKPIQPLLELGCKVAGCTVPSIQNTKDIEQLSSRLTPLAGNDGGFKVDSILVNRAIGSQAYPALELTLTDRAGNIISRRVVTPDKYLTKQDSPEMKPNAAVDISIRFRTPSIRVDGFELRPVSQNWLERSKQAN